MNTYLRPALSILLLLTLITGVAYPFAMTGLAQMLFPHAANGSLIERDGKLVGSALIGQNFVSERYFHSRPSATSTADPVDATKTIDAPYNAASSSGSNLGSSSKALKDAIVERAAAYGQGPLPADLVTASGSGLDPHLSPAAALVQVTRIAKSRGIPVDALQRMVEGHIEGRELGVIGQPRVNILVLNLALDKIKP
ncbi:MAG: potassium-transporting ATPase subunit C [Rhizobiales bacterium PAR1]|nr:MAG: potassium-transporting ATPase subunit C [Rhizobiales bacterium PAR1]